MRTRFLIALIAIIAGFSIVTAPPRVEAQTAKECKKTCKTGKRACLKGVKADFKDAKAECKTDFTGKDRKTCIKEAKNAGKPVKKLCKKGSTTSFKECKQCCKGDDLSTCAVVVCGDGVIGGNEACDNGVNDNSNTEPDACRADCTLAQCSDGVKDSGEECDGTDAAFCGANPCLENCTCFCGNGTVDEGEACDFTVDDGACGPGFICDNTCACITPVSLSFTTAAPGGPCGRVNDAADGSGTDLTPYGSMSGAQLDCGGLYIGGGGSVQPPSPTPDGSTTIFTVTDATDLTALVLAATTSGDTGTDRNCSTPGCFFGSPLPIPNPSVPAVSTCVINQIAPTPPAGGTLDATTGVSTQTLPLDSTVYATGDLDGSPGPPIQPCPKCVGGLCDFGPNAGMACTPSGSLATSHDCPPPGSPLPTFGVDLSPLGTGTVTASAADGLFCSATTGQQTLGCFGDPTCRYMEENGSPAGDLLDGLPHNGILGSVFCIPPTGSALIDAIADLPGTGAVSLTGELSLVFGTSRPPTTTTTAPPTTTTTAPPTTSTSTTTTSTTTSSTTTTT